MIKTRTLLPPHIHTHARCRCVVLWCAVSTGVVRATPQGGSKFVDKEELAKQKGYVSVVCVCGVCGGCVCVVLAFAAFTLLNHFRVSVCLCVYSVIADVVKSMGR